MNKPLDIAIVGDIKADDDYLHAVQSADNFSESNLFYYAGKSSTGKSVGGIIRVANRPNQGFAEATVLYFAGDGSALFQYERPEISNNDSWKVSGWNLDVVTPGGIEFTSVYQGKALLLKDPHLLETPKLAYQEPKVNLSLQMNHYGKSPMAEFRYNKKIDDPRQQDIKDTRGIHQLTSFSGSVAVGDSPAESISGFGWRDHNWGPRNWQAFPRHAFYTGNFAEGQGFVLWKTEGGLGYFMHDGPDEIYEVTALDIATEYEADGREPKSMKAKVTLDNGTTHTIVGRKIAYIPLRNRRGETTTHLGYSMWDYQLNGMQEGSGIAEHLSQSNT